MVQMSELQVDKACHRAIREGGYVMNPAAAILRRAQDLMGLADCAHGTVTQLTGHIIARRSTPPEPGSRSGWRSLGEREDCEKGKGNIGMPDQTPWSLSIRVMIHCGRFMIGPIGAAGKLLQAAI